MKRICPACKKSVEVKNIVKSVMHLHPAAHKAQKTVQAVISFIDPVTKQPLKICKGCQDLVVSGVANGKNFG